MPADDLEVLSSDLRASARVEGNGEVAWHVDDAPEVLRQLADANRVVLGLDIRDYDHAGRFFESALSAYNGENPIDARNAALHALQRGDVPGDWVLITW